MRDLIRILIVVVVANTAAYLLITSPIMRKLSPASIDWTWPANCALAALNEAWGDHFVCDTHREKV